jgi:dTDP-4-dehydrorhamnose reductase
MKTLVTGASGFLGREIVARLRPTRPVTAIGHAHAGAGQTVLDLRDADALRGFLRNEAPDCVIHCAAYRDPDFCEEHPAEAARLNVDPVRVMCETLPPSCRFVQISTDYVFDGETPPYAESSPRRPINRYGETKAAAEDWVLRREGSLVLRMPLLVGAGPNWAESGWIAQLYGQLKNPAPQEADHAAFRFPTWIGDVAEAVAFLLDRGETGIFHVSSSLPLTRVESLLQIARIAGLSAAHIRPSSVPVRQKARRPRDSRLDTSALRALGFREPAPFEQVVREVLARFARLPESGA